MLYEPPVAAAPLSSPLSSLPLQADISIAAAMAVATSALLRLLNFTCNSSLNPLLRGERTGRSVPSEGPRTTDWSRAKRTWKAETSLIRRLDPRHAREEVS